MTNISIQGGDRDCSSAIISAYQAVGLDVNASYTGNMADVFLQTGEFEHWGLDQIAQRGDIYLNHANHTAMCVDDGSGAYGYDALAEFSLSENGGIYGEVGDQTGWESHICGYYDYPWDCILHCTNRERAEAAAQVMEHLCNCSNHGYSQGNRWGDGTTEYIEVNANCEGSTNNAGDYDTPLSYTGAEGLRYQVRVGGQWLGEMDGFSCADGCGDDYAGYLGQPIEYLAINFNGWYQVKTQANGWLEKVTGYDINDLENGCAGDGSPIIAIRCYYETPNPDATGYQVIEYQAHILGADWLNFMHDLTDTTGDSENFAGDNDQVIDGFRARLVNE